MISIWVCSSILISFIITFFLTKRLIPYLHKIKFGQTILEVGPSWHKKKQGTPTMGGIAFIIGILVASFVCLASYYLVFKELPLMILKILAGLLMALMYGIVGFLDDYIKVFKKQNLGLTAGQKLIMQFLIAYSYLFLINFSSYMYGNTDLTSTILPFFGKVDLGLFYWIICPIFIVGMVNAVNLTDGIDGLCASVTFFAGLFFILIAGLLNMFGVSVVTGALLGGCLGFLMFNMYPAKIFMGDTGSLFFGGLLSAIAFTLDIPVILIFIGIVYIFEMFSVIIQVVYFKLTHGKRLFKMTPIHHHFELSGFNELKICATFSMVTIVFGIIALIFIAFGK